jgi:hypothetical protein
MAATGAVQRAIGLFVPKRSDLRRRSDKIEIAARWVLLLVGLLLVPVASAIGSQVTADLVPQVAGQRAERHEVSAEVLADPDHRFSSRADLLSDVARVPVRWFAADGTARVVEVAVPATVRAGDSRVIWVDAHDRPAVAPMPPHYPAVQGFLTTAVILLGDLLVSLGLLAGLRWLLDRARSRAWDAAWRRFTGPDHESSR